MPDLEKTSKDRAEFIKSRKEESRNWLRDDYWKEWEVTYKNYHAVPDIKKDDDGKEDPEITNLGSPLTFRAVRSSVARVTAQGPQFQFRANEAYQMEGSAPLSEVISTTQMFQWDRAGMQRIQKKHVLQAMLFGWSPRLWYWAYEVYPRNKRINPADALQNPDLLRQIEATYDIEPGIAQRLIKALGPEEAFMKLNELLAKLLEKYGKGSLLPIKYTYKEYEGPKADFTFIGDCFPQPHFQSLRTCKWFIANQLRDHQWLTRMAEQHEEMRTGIEELLKEKPRGDGTRLDGTNTRDDNEFMRNLLATVNRATTSSSAAALEPESEYEGEWLITEHHCRAKEPYIEYMDAVTGTYLGKIPYPYDLAGRIAVTDCVLIDDIVSGIGDSTARIMRGLHKVHSEQLGYQNDAVKNVLRPLIFTNDRNLYENPEQLRRKHGFRLVWAMRPDSIWQQQELAALSAIQSGISNDQSILHTWYMMSGENSMSSMATVDPGNTRTAAGVNYVANNQDILTKDMNDAFLYSSLREDADMMYLLNRSELTDEVEFESSQYNRATLYSDDKWKENWVRAEPQHFQIDGQVGVKAGSTLAEDDGVKQQEAKELYGAALANPQNLNVNKARDNLLIATGHRGDMGEWMPPQQPKPEPEIKVSCSFSGKFEEMTPTERISVLEKAGIIPEGSEPTPGMAIDAIGNAQKALAPPAG